ncbi:hypothetical protein DES40_1510 [Litorimonas taeanensis]|uniref:Flagellar motility protein MotE (MotC chaperone) n=1 Tax=Litorimonas taeanensis TaxID=568099 RepID=A0A420WMD1_9PROT|nr:hypothetical protein [Litorimonas taeanensis]RKQ72173.1 hypothetical protein DES40_1510 [Litorimonas taeanensis]
MKSRILPIIAVSFGLVTALQLTNLSFASAKNKADGIVETKTDKPAKPVLSDVSGDENLSEDAICLTSTMADAILAEKDRIEKQKISLNERETALEALEVKLSAQLENIQTTKSSVEAQLARMEAVASEDLDHLISMYSTMKPKKAAEIFDSMAPAFAAGFLRDMNSAKAGLIMSEMSAKQSYEISLVIANRNAAIRNASNN